MINSTSSFLEVRVQGCPPTCTATSSRVAVSALWGFTLSTTAILSTNTYFFSSSQSNVPISAGARSIPTTVRLPTLPCTSISPRTSPERFRWPAVWILNNHAVDDQEWSWSQYWSSLFQVSGVSSRSLSRTGMRTLVDNLQAESPRPRLAVFAHLITKQYCNLNSFLITRLKIYTFLVKLGFYTQE